MGLIDADKLGEVKFHSLPYTHITPSDVEAESYKRGWNDAIDSIIENAPTIEPERVGDPDRIYTELSKVYNTKGLSDEVYSIIGDLMISLPDEPERKKGKWVDAVLPNDSGGLQVQVCDQCNTFFPLAYTGGGHNFCPHCGADMRGEDDE